MIFGPGWVGDTFLLSGSLYRRARHPTGAREWAGYTISRRQKQAARDVLEMPRSTGRNNARLSHLRGDPSGPYEHPACLYVQL